VYLANLVGAFGLVLLVLWSQHWHTNNESVGINAVKIAAAKATLPFWEAFFKGILCNILVCLAVWLALAGRSVVDKVVAIISLYRGSSPRVSSIASPTCISFLWEFCWKTGSGSPVRKVFRGWVSGRTCYRLLSGMSSAGA
jgi:Formate/nitrite transporter